MDNAGVTALITYLVVGLVAVGGVGAVLSFFVDVAE
jgi:hypothetical protein